MGIMIERVGVLLLCAWVLWQGAGVDKGQTIWQPLAGTTTERGCSNLMWQVLKGVPAANPEDLLCLPVPVEPGERPRRHP